MNHKLHGVTQRGFTIVELLIVVVIIGILAAIVIVAYNGVTNTAKTNAVMSDLNNFKKKIEQAKITSSDGKYPAPFGATTNPISASHGIKATKDLYTTISSAPRNNWYYCPSADRNSYALGVAVKPGDAGYILSSANGIQSSTSVWSSNTGDLVGLTNGSGCSSGYVNTSGQWQSWVNS